MTILEWGLSSSIIVTMLPSLIISKNLPSEIPHMIAASVELTDNPVDPIATCSTSGKHQRR
jgi:predicted cobalt transporter CbtA